jgi:hypothetical protein
MTTRIVGASIVAVANTVTIPVAIGAVRYTVAIAIVVSVALTLVISAMRP